MTIPLVQVSKRAAGAQGTVHGSQVEEFTRPSEGDNCPKLKAKEQGQSRQWVQKQQRPQARMVCSREASGVRRLVWEAEVGPYHQGP